MYHRSTRSTTAAALREKEKLKEMSGGHQTRSSMSSSYQPMLSSPAIEGGSSGLSRRPSTSAVQVPFESASVPPSPFLSDPRRASSARDLPRKLNASSRHSFGGRLLDWTRSQSRNRIIRLVLGFIAFIVLVRAIFGRRVDEQAASGTGVTRTLRKGPKDALWSNRPSGMSQHWLPTPWEKHRLTIMHAVIRRRADTYEQRFDGVPDTLGSEGYFVQILGFVEETPFKPNSAVPGTLLSAHPNVLESVTCHFRASASAAVDMTEGNIIKSHVSDVIDKEHEWATVINCPVPPVHALLSKGTITVDLKLNLKNSTKPFNTAIELSRSIVPKPLPGSASICIAPLWSHTPVSQLLEWRVHHRDLGVETVHWYARDASVHKWVEALNREIGVSDDFMFAPPISRETFGKSGDGLLTGGGQYADQGLYYLDCKLRQMSSYNPTEWVSFTDVDEYLLPYIFPPVASISNFASSIFGSQPRRVASVCISRTNYQVPEKTLQHNWDGLHFGTFSGYYPPSERNADSSKCIHRVKGVETASIHRPDVMYPGYEVKELASENSEVRLMHQKKIVGVEPPLLQFKEQPYATLYWKKLLADKNAALKKMGVGSRFSLKALKGQTRPPSWPCADVPCAF